MSRPLYPRERSGTHCLGGWVAPGPVWTGAENLTPTGIRSSDRPARSESLYRLRYPGPLLLLLVLLLLLLIPHLEARPVARPMNTVGAAASCASVDT
jgi:hypothetical protein